MGGFPMGRGPWEGPCWEGPMGRSTKAAGRTPCGRLHHSEESSGGDWQSQYREGE
jgi:hypothetical protein